MEKLMYIAWDTRARSRAAVRDALLGECAPALLDAGVRGLALDIDDPEADVPSPAPKLRPGPRMSAVVSLWVDRSDRRAPFEQLLRDAGFRLAGYLVTESLYTEYGGNRHAPPRDWPDGARSPGLLTVTALEKPPRIADDAEWYRRWYGRQSPVSEAMQPRSRYVRNAVVRALTPDAPPLRGIVEEAWPSPRHIRNPFLFYGAKGPIELARNMGAMLASVKSFLDLTRIETTTMSEYLIRTPPRP